MNERVRDTLRKLRLSGLAASLDVRLEEAMSCKLTHMKFLELILQDELSASARWSTNTSLARSRGSCRTVGRGAQGPGQTTRRPFLCPFLPHAVERSGANREQSLSLSRSRS
jgi:hypothetical protein